jgi:hypothetical protein
MIFLFDDWIIQNKKPPLIIGKGPTYDLISKICSNKYLTIGLNHTISKQKVDIGHAIDIEVVEDLKEQILENCKYFLMPWYPNKNFEVGDKNLDELSQTNKTLATLKEQARLLTYNRKNGKTPCRLGGASILPIFFSGDTVFQLLSVLGQKTIYSIGLDGGCSYSKEYNKYVPLENSRKSFDEQFSAINKIMEITGSKLIRLGDLEPLHIFVGSQQQQYVPSMVLKNSIMKNTHNPVFFNMLCDFPISFKMPKKEENKPRTPFSFQRFLIPSLMNNTGTAFYLDSDMQVFGDLSDLLNLSFDDSEVICCTGMEKYGHWKGSEYAVLMINCEKAKWDINNIVGLLDSGELSYEDLMFKFKLAKVKKEIPPEWNSLDVYEDKKTKLLHYTDMSRQPWIFPNHPYENLWLAGLQDSIKNNILTLDIVENHKSLGFIR